ncbi:chitin disaccharide deacetylase [Endozoicomonas lisbonensis]|uniref:Carbohydrate deacetylase n=1 Tax=Endozoicomonas lisbonensis TaxID=3120522 RepID=A0ABV2SEX5_9GAMM
MKLIINADDFGLSPGVNHGIVDAFKLGVVRSTTMMVGMPGEAHGVELAKANPQLSVGIHLRLTAGKPLCDNLETLTDSSGLFLDQLSFYDSDNLCPKEIEQEFRAQIEHFLKLGLTPTHLDSHHHCYGHPIAQPVIIKLSREYDLPHRTVDASRVTEIVTETAKYTYRFTDHFYGETSQQMLLDIVDKELAARGHNAILEVMCHPAYIDQGLMEASSYTEARVREFEILTSAELQQNLASREVELTDYKEISKLISL